MQPIRGTWVNYQMAIVAVPTLFVALFFGVVQFFAKSCGASGTGAELMAGLAFAVVPHNSLLTSLFGLSFERALEYHKWFAYTSILCMVAHYVACGSDFDGFLLMGVMGGLGIFSIPVFRRHFFELFYRLHWVLFLLAACLLLIHEGGKGSFFGVCVWLADVVYRYGYLAWNKYPRKAMIFSLPANVIRVEVPKVRFPRCCPQLSFLFQIDRGRPVSVNIPGRFSARSGNVAAGDRFPKDAAQRGD
jgi:hypothetical protein